MKYLYTSTKSHPPLFTLPPRVLGDAVGYYRAALTVFFLLLTYMFCDENGYRICRK
jgi:hypothetical protein